MDTQIRPISSELTHDERAFGEDYEVSQSVEHNELIINLMLLIQWIFAKRLVRAYTSIELTGDPLFPNHVKSPDLVLIDGWRPGPHQSHVRYRIGKDGPPPLLVLEVASESTWPIDLNEKVEVYARMGISEYFSCDPQPEQVWTGVWRQQGRLVGWRLLPGSQVYEPLEKDAQGRLWSDVLQSWLVMEGSFLSLFDRDGHQRLSLAEVEHEGRIFAEVRGNYLAVERDEERKRADEAEAEREAERQRAEVERQRAEVERQRADKAETDLEAERKRADELAALLRQLQQKLEGAE